MVYFRTDIGRLGNQLFIVAFALTLRKIYGTEFVLSNCDFSKFFYFNKKYNWVKGQFFFRVLLKFRDIEKVDFLNLNSFHNEALSRLSKGQYKCLGYFQSPYYFEIHTNYIKKKIRIRSGFVKMFESMYGSLYNSSNHITAIHIRRTDYAQHSIPILGNTPVILPISYYKKAVDIAYVLNTKYVLVGDDLDYLEEAFSFLPNKVIIHQSEIIDLQALINANCCILSNSTFAWWGGYLNTKINAKIYAPSRFLGYNSKAEYPKLIYPKKWIQVD